ncbi:MAG TPA: acyltransferase [Alphaproteobacteria bacterium]|nr:acyltransferase [Alphaproteobacteria bacterium]
MNHSPNGTRKEHEFLVLDGLRGFAAISVMIFHYTGSLSHYAWRWPLHAFLAVDFFFVLSGFVIAHAYGIRLASGRQFIGEFMTRRLIRLYPLYLVGLSLLMAALAAKAALGGLTVSSIPRFYTYACGLFFLPSPPSLLTGNPAYANVFPLDTPAWTLSLEIGINLVYALLCRYLTTPRLAVLVFLNGIGLTVAVWLNHKFDIGWNWPSYAGGWARVFWSFFAGVLLYRVFCLFEARNHKHFNPWVGVLLALILIVIFSIHRVYEKYDLLVGVLLSPLAVLIGARTAIWHPLHRVYAWLGRTSYALYILHSPLLWVFIYISKHLYVDPFRHSEALVPVFAFLSLLIASMLDIVYDMPVRSFLTHRLNSRLPAQGVA